MNASTDSSMNDERGAARELQKAPSNRLWWIALAPFIWSVHFLACYIPTAVYCEKFSHEDRVESTLYVYVAIVTFLAISIMVVIGRTSYQQHCFFDSSEPRDYALQEDQLRFFGFTAFLLTMLSVVATIFTAAVFVFVGTCD